MNKLGLMFALLIAMGCLVAAGAVRADDHSHGEMLSAEVSRLQGTWRALKLQVGNRAVEVPGKSKKNPGVTLEIHGDHYEFRGLGAELKGHFHSTASNKDKRLEFVRDDGTTTISTYRLNGESLRLTGVSASQNAKEAEKDAEVWTFEREKP